MLNPNFCFIFSGVENIFTWIAKNKYLKDKIRNLTMICINKFNQIVFETKFIPYK